MKQPACSAILASLLVTACDTDDEPDYGEVVLFVAGATELSGADAIVESRLGTMMYETRVIDEPSLSQGDVEEQDVGFVYVSASVTSSTSLVSIADTRKTVLVAQAYVADDFGIVESDAKVREVNSVTAPDQPLDTWTIEGGMHPAVGMQSAGALVVWGADGSNVVPMVEPIDSASVVATWAGDEDFATLVALDRGATLPDGETKAPARRALFAHEPRAPEIFTADGWDLFESTVMWVFER